MTFEAHWHLDASPSDEWPMAIEADKTGINAIRMPVEHEDGDVSIVRFVPASEMMGMAENERLREENANLKSLLREALEKKFSDEDRLQSENAKLRELVSLYEYGATHEASSPSDVLKWSIEIGELRKELGIEVK